MDTTTPGTTPAQPLAPIALFFVRFLDQVLAGVRARVTEERFDRATRTLVYFGHYALLAGAALGLALGIVLAVRDDSLRGLLAGIGWVCLILALQYTAVKFMSAGDALVASTPNRLGSPALLDCFALLNLVGAIVAVIWFAILAGRFSNANWLWLGVGTAGFCAGLLAVSVNPRCLNMTVAPNTTADEEALSVVTFLTKAFLKIVPFCFGFWAIAGTVGLAVASVDILRGEAPEASVFLARSTAAGLVFWAALLPLFGYLVFLAYYLSIAVLRAVLAVPRKLDELRPPR
jgi:hypothetical protein